MYVITKDVTTGRLTVRGADQSFTFPAQDASLLMHMLEGECPECDTCGDRGCGGCGDDLDDMAGEEL